MFFKERYYYIIMRIAFFGGSVHLLTEQKWQIYDRRDDDEVLPTKVHLKPKSLGVACFLVLRAIMSLVILA